MEEEFTQFPQEEDKKKVETFWDNPINVLHLIDLLFLDNEQTKYPS